MWVPLAALLLVGAVVADNEHGWKPGKEYYYMLQSQTLTGLDDLHNQFTGIIIRAVLTVQPQTADTLRALVLTPQYAHVHKYLKDGWETPIPHEMLEFHNLPMSGKPFDIKMKHGVIRDLVTEREVPTWEVNILKSIVSQLQVDTQGENAMRSRSTQVPDDDEPYGMFKAMEDSVGGKCEVLYDITPLAENILNNKPELAYFPQLKEDGELIDIIKTKNYSRCEQRMDYHFGIGGKNNWEPGSNENGRLLAKSSVSRIVISGNLKRFTIQSSVTVNKVFASPRVYDRYSGGVVSKVNLTLVNIMDPPRGPIPALSNPESTGNLVYTYNNPFSDSEHRRPGRPSVSPNSREEKDMDSTMTSSEDGNFLQQKPSLDEAPHNPLLPYFIGNKGKAIGMSDKVDPTKEAKQLIYQIANEMEDPSSIQTQQTLEKFTILTTLLRTMNRKQIAEIEKTMNLSPTEWKTNEKHQSKKQNAWDVFRDVVAQAGTGPALLTIKDWIENGKVEGIEAAEILSSLPKNARVPTPEYVDALFELVKNPEVTKQEVLNSSAILAFSELVRESQVDERSMHNRYPVHAFGRLSSKHNQAVQQVYIPYLARQLREAIKDGDSPRIQTYILGLGRIGHPKILSVFEPFLEGKERISTFQRTVMVAALGHLADIHPRLARSVLYKIYLNTMEAHEVRCTAVYLLMKTNPPLAMLQRMAEFTHHDTSKHVNSAVTSTIRSLANLKRQETMELANKARAALLLLKEKEYGYQYSSGYMVDADMEDLDLAYRLIVNYIGSDDSMLARGWYLGLETSYGGFEPPNTEMQAMVSSVKALADMFFAKEDKEDKKEKSRTEKIVEILNIEPEDPVQVEGHLLWTTKYGDRFFAFDNHTLERIPEMAKKIFLSTKNGRHFNLNCMSAYEMTMSFPTETGLPFVYSLKVPRWNKFSGYVKGVADPEITDIKSEFRVVDALKIQGRMGFVTPFEHQRYIAGVDVSSHVYVPAKVETEINVRKNTMELKLWPLKSEKDAKLMHYSVIPFTSKHDILNLRPVLTDKNTQKVHTKDPETKKLDFPGKQGKVIVISLSADDLKNDITLGSKDDILGHFIFPWSRNNNKYREVEISVDLDDVPEDPVLFRITVDSMDAKGESEDSEEWTTKAMSLESSDKGPNGEIRRKQFIREAAAGIASGKAYVVDMRLDTPGEIRSTNALTFSWADSNSEDKSRGMLFWQFEMPDLDAKYEVCAATTMKSSQARFMDLESALKSKPRIDFDVDIRYGDKCFNGGQIEIKGKGEQSETFKEKIRKSPAVKECNEQMKEGNKGLRTCQEAIDVATTLDELEMSVDLHSEVLQEVAEAAIDLVKSKISDVRVDASKPKNAGKNKIGLKVKMSDDLDTADVSLHTSVADITFPTVDLELGNKEIVLTNEDSLLKASDDLDPMCVLDKTKAETFDGRMYPLRLGNCWHVAMTTYPKENPDNPNESIRIPEEMRISVLSRETEDGKEIKIHLDDKEIRLTPTGSHVKVTVDGTKVQVSKDKGYQNRNEEGEMEFEILELPGGLIRVISDKFNFDALFDGKRIQIKGDEEYEGSVRGLCGNFNGEPDDDFSSPQNCMLREPEDFIASFALVKEECEGPSRENARNLKKAECKRKTNRMSNVINDFEAGRATRTKKNWGYHATENRDDKQCNTYRTQVAEVDDKICFTMRPVPSCSDGCYATDTKTKNYQFHCMKRNEASLEMKKRVEKGANPDLSQKTPSLTRSIHVPLECRA